MGLRDRAEIEALLKLAARQRQRLRELEASLHELYRRIGRIRRTPPDDDPDPRSGKPSKAFRKK
jgi:hypothetical protein